MLGLRNRALVALVIFSVLGGCTSSIPVAGDDPAPLPLGGAADSFGLDLTLGPAAPSARFTFSCAERCSLTLDVDVAVVGDEPERPPLEITIARPDGFRRESRAGTGRSQLTFGDLPRGHYVITLASETTLIAGLGAHTNLHSPRGVAQLDLELGAGAGAGRDETGLVFECEEAEGCELTVTVATSAEPGRHDAEHPLEFTLTEDHEWTRPIPAGRDPGTGSFIARAEGLKNGFVYSLSFVTPNLEIAPGATARLQAVAEWQAMRPLRERVAERIATRRAALGCTTGERAEMSRWAQQLADDAAAHENAPTVLPAHVPFGIIGLRSLWLSFVEPSVESAIYSIEEQSPGFVAGCKEYGIGSAIGANGRAHLGLVVSAD